MWHADEMNKCISFDEMPGIRSGIESVTGYGLARARESVL
jgi:hypothetical protein